MLVLLPLLAHIVAPSAGAKAAGRCVASAPQPSQPPLRATPTARCSYGAGALNRRILSLVRQAPRTLEVATVERVFGLPRLHTLYDSPRSAAYSTILSGSADTWQAMLWFDEDFFPTDRARQPRFTGGLRPTRLQPRRRGTLQVGIQWLRPEEIRPGSAACLPNGTLAAAARGAGWRVSWETALVMDGPQRPVLSLTRGRGSITVAADAPCVTSFEIVYAGES